MAKYKKIHESFGENFAKLIKRVEDSRNDVEDYISKKIKNTKIPKSKQKALNRGEWPF